MTHSDGTRARARLAGLLFLGVNVVYIASVLAGASGPDALHRPAVALQVLASAATILMAWAFYELLKPVGQGLALMALLFRVAEAAIFGVVAFFSLLLADSGGGTSGQGVDLLPLARQAQSGLGQIGSIYFCGGSGIFFHLLRKSRIIPAPIAVFGLVATFLSLASGLAEIGAPDVAGYLRLSGVVLLLAETTTGIALLVAGRRATPDVDVTMTAV